MTDTTSDPLSAIDHHHQHHQQIFTALVMTITFFVGVPGNLLVIWITSVKMKWTVNTIWFWNLAVADVAYCLSLPFSILQLFYSEWLYGAALCKMLPIIVQLNMFASVFTLVVISIDRCALVVRPVWAQNHRSLRMAWMLCLVIWILSFFMCLPSILYRKIFTNPSNQTVCLNEFPEPDYYDYSYSYDYDYNITVDHITPINPTHLTITVTRMVFGFLIPLLIICICYLRLALKVRNTRLGKASRKTTKVVYGIIVAFFVTWAPYHILGMLLLYFSSPLVSILDHVSVALAYFSSCINPILYVFMGKVMKNRVRKSIGGLMESALGDEVSRSTEQTRSKVTMDDSVAV